MSGTDVLGELLFKFHDARALADPTASKSFQYRLFFLGADEWARNGNVHRYFSSDHYRASTTATAVFLSECFQRISSSSPCSSPTLATKSSMRSALSTAARRA